MDMDEELVVPHAEEEDEDEEESEEEVEDSDDDDDHEGVLDGGVAEPVEPGKPRRNASLADITLFLTCTESLPFLKNHPILKIGVTVQIGLSKSCKLSTVFNRYVEFCNENGGGNDRVELSDLEFVHSQVLSGSDTAEAAALMKSDRISVRRERSTDRKDEEVRNRLQRESDKEYFAQLRQFLPPENSSESASPHYVQKYSDVALECRGSLPQVNGQYDQPKTPESTSVLCHSFIIAKRCPWLGRIISAARQEQTRGSVVTVPENEEAKELEDEENFEMLQLKMRPRAGDKDPAAAKIENDDEEQGGARARQISGVNDDASSNTARNSNFVDVVPIDNHAPEAVKLLLEYCYSNRVVPLGYHAFFESCKTKPQYKKQIGPVAPFSNRPGRWPNGGEPTISFAVALAGIQLAEEASMHRLSLMCEIAASRLVDESWAIDALLACETQRKLSDNALPRLRKAAMDAVLLQLHVPNYDLTAVLLNGAMMDKGQLLVPSLLTGTMEALKSVEKSKKKTHHGRSSEERDWQTTAYSSFEKVDRLDARERERERCKRRRGDDSECSSAHDIFDADEDILPSWGERSAQQISLKRMSHHMDGRLASRLANKIARRSSGTKVHKRTSR